MDSRLARTFENRLLEEISREGSAIVTGAAVDIADYKYRVGVVRGMKRALAVLDDTERELKGAGN